MNKILFFLFLTIISTISEAGVKKFVVAGLSSKAVDRVLIPAILEGKGIDKAISIAKKFKKSKIARNYIYQKLSVYIISEPESIWAQNAADIIIGAGLNDSAFEKRIDQEMANFHSHIATFTEVASFIDYNDSESDCFDKNAIYSTNLKTPFFNIDNPVKEWNYGSYKELTKNSMRFDKLENDHIPSSASVLEYLSNKDNKNLIKSIGNRFNINNPADNVHQNATAISVLESFHKHSRTYKGKNKVLKSKDSKNLKLATIKDFAYYFSDKRKISKNIINSFIEVYSRNKYLCLYEGL